MLLTNVTRKLERAHPAIFSAYCITAAFMTYFCMYAFRKPFTAAEFADIHSGWGLAYKPMLIASQTVGYTLSKFWGIKFISELPPRRRSQMLITLIAVAHAALALFAIVPSQWAWLLLFVNGLPLGMVFGLVLGYLEGRQVTEALSAGLCASFIASSGFVRSVGKSLVVTWGVDEFWMPFCTGALFWLPFLLGVWLLRQIPGPNRQDVAARAPREPIDARDRMNVLRRHWAGLLSLILVYMLLTILRGVRDDFGAELWGALGFAEKPAVFAQSEMLVMLVVLLLNGAAFVIRDNRFAFFTSLLTVAAGALIIVAGVVAFLTNAISGFGFMVVVGVGTYVPYVAFHTTVFERMISIFRDRSNLGYFMYLADAFGYLGYVGSLVVVGTAVPDDSLLTAFVWLAIGVASATLVLIGYSSSLFLKRVPDHVAMEATS
ncbi:MAG: DUF5690 family protein [Pirellulaceae bacterium]|nr:hypothetical protein [Planctomycetales bacterium]